MKTLWNYFCAIIFPSIFAFLGNKCFKIKSLVCLSLICYFFIIVIVIMIIILLVDAIIGQVSFCYKHYSKKIIKCCLTWLLWGQLYLLLGESLMHFWSRGRQDEFRCSSLYSLHVWNLRCTLLKFLRSHLFTATLIVIMFSFLRKTDVGSPRIMTECKFHHWRVLHGRRGEGGGEQDRFTGGEHDWNTSHTYKSM